VTKISIKKRHRLAFYAALAFATALREHRHRFFVSSIASRATRRRVRLLERREVGRWDAFLRQASPKFMAGGRC
jgi:hypothetical protein